jgi:hypothetical protein
MACNSVFFIGFLVWTAFFEEGQLCEEHGAPCPFLSVYQSHILEIFRGVWRGVFRTCTSCPQAVDLAETWLLARARYAMTSVQGVYGRPAQYCQFSRRTGVPPVLADGLPACRFIGGQAGRAVYPHRLEACSPINKR